MALESQARPAVAPGRAVIALTAAATAAQPQTRGEGATVDTRPGKPQ